MTKKPAVPDPSGMTFAPLGAESGRSPVVVDSEAALADVVAWIKSPYRTAPLVVVTSGTDRGKPWIDAEALAAARSDASVYVIPRVKFTRSFADYLPAKWEVYGGGGRVYPPRVDFNADPRSAPLVLCQGAGDGEKATGALIVALQRSTGNRRARSRPPQTGPANERPPAMSQGLMAKPHSGVGRVATSVAAVELAQRLLDPSRQFPVVVVTNASGHSPYLDAERIAEDLDGLAEVSVLVHGEASWAFTGALPARLGVFGGAARVYPVDRDWLQDETRAPLLFCWGGVGAKRITTKAIEAGLSAAHAAGLLSPTGAPAKARQCLAVVKGGLGDFHLLVELPDGRQAVALTAAIRPGVPADRLVTKGHHLSGYVEGGGGGLARFRPIAVPDDPAARVRSDYPPGAVVLAKVVDVGELSAKVALHPDVEVWLLADRSGPPLTRLIDADDVIAVEIDGDGDALRCRLPDEDDPPLPAVSVIPGGPPWLVPADLDEDEEQIEVPLPGSAPSEDAPTPAPVTPPVSTPAVRGQLEAANRERDLLDTRLSRVEAELAAAKAEAGRLRRSLREAGKLVKRASKRAEELDDRAHGIGMFGDPDAQLRHEIRLQYLYRIPEPQRAGLPLAEYRFGPRFLESLDQLEGITRDKVVDVLVEVLTGLVRSIQGRQLHPWKVSAVGAQETRSDGGSAWRCSLQVNTPSARRLKYWQLPAAVVEFDSVGVHDDGI